MRNMEVASVDVDLTELVDLFQDDGIWERIMYRHFLCNIVND